MKYLILLQATFGESGEVATKKVFEIINSGTNEGYIWFEYKYSDKATIIIYESDLRKAVMDVSENNEKVLSYYYIIESKEDETRKSLIELATKAYGKGWDYDRLLYSDDTLTLSQDEKDMVWDYVTEAKDIGRRAFREKYKDINFYWGF